MLLHRGQMPEPPSKAVPATLSRHAGMPGELLGGEGTAQFGPPSMRADEAAKALPQR